MRQPPAAAPDGAEEAKGIAEETKADSSTTGTSLARRVADFSRQRNNTHDTYVTRSIARYLYDLEQKYKESSQIRWENSHAYFLLECKEVLGKSEEVLLKVGNYINSKAAADFNPTFERISFLVKNVDGSYKTHTYDFSFLNVLRTVCCALMDDDACVQDDMAGKTEAEARTAVTANRAARLDTLFNVLGELANSAICQVGVRNQIGLTLNHVYKDVVMVEVIEGYLLECLREGVVAILERDFPDQKQALMQKWVLSGFGELEAVLFEDGKLKEPYQRELIEQLSAKCRDQGIEPNPDVVDLRNAYAEPGREDREKLADKILGYVELIRDLEAPYHDKQAVRLAYIRDSAQLETGDKARDAVFKSAWESLQAGTSPAAERIEALVTFEEWRLRLEHYRALLLAWNSDEKTQAHIKTIDETIKRFFSRKLSVDDEAKLRSNHSFLLATEAIDTLIASLLRDAMVADIPNFFASFYASAKQTQARLSDLLKTPGFVTFLKTKLTDNALALIFRGELRADEAHGEAHIEVPITVGVINLMFLYALTVPVTDWSPHFRRCFESTLQFVKAQLGRTDARVRGEHLRRDSYPEALCYLLDHLLETHQHCETWRQANPEKPITDYSLAFTPAQAVTLFSRALDVTALFLNACGLGVVPIAQRLLDERKIADIDIRNALKETALMRAAANGHVEAVIFLLDNGAAVDARNKWQETVLMYAALNGHKKVVELLLAKGADVNARDTTHSGTALIRAAAHGHANVVSILLAKPEVDVNAKDDGPMGTDKTALMFAALNGHKKVVELLLAKEANVNAKDLDGKTALMLAAEKGHADVVSLLLPKLSADDVNAKNVWGETALMLAAEYGHEEMVTLLKEDGRTLGEAGCNQLMRAACDGDIELARKILEKGRVDVNAKDSTGRTALMYAAENGHANVVSILLAKPEVDVNVKDSTGRTALMYAAENGHVEAVRFLLDNGAVVDARNKWQKTALMLAAQYGRKEVVELLLAKEANVNAKDLDGKTALMLAAQYGRKEVVELLLAKEANVNAKDLDGKTALMLAAENGHADVVSLLLPKLSADDVNAKNVWGETALELAAEYGHEEMVTLLKEDGRTLGEAGCNQLMRAACDGDIELARKILEKGRVDVNAKDSRGKTALELAAENRHEETIKLLKEDGRTLDEAGYNQLMLAIYRGEIELARTILINRRVDIHACNSQNETALDIAVNRERRDMISMTALLISHYPNPQLQPLLSRLVIYISTRTHNRAEYIKAGASRLGGFSRSAKLLAAKKLLSALSSNELLPSDKALKQGELGKIYRDCLALQPKASARSDARAGTDEDKAVEVAEGLRPSPRALPAILRQSTIFAASATVEQAGSFEPGGTPTNSTHVTLHT